MSAQPGALARQAGLLGWSIGSKPARQCPCRDVPSLDWTVRVKGNRTQHGFGRAAGIVEKALASGSTQAPPIKAVAKLEI